MDKKKIQELAGKIKTLSSSPKGIDPSAAVEIFKAAVEIDNETRKQYPGAAAVVV